MQIHHMWGKQSSSFQEVDGLAPGASEHHGPAKAREPGGPAGNRAEHPTPLYNRLSRPLCTRGNPATSCAHKVEAEFKDILSAFSLL